jgi:hypothetical protein
MLKDIVSVMPLEGFRLLLRFEDGVEGIVNVAECVQFTGVFAALRNAEEFAAVRLNPELGSICWPSGADLEPDVLYSLITCKPIPSYGFEVKAG